MTAVDVDALDELREELGSHRWLTDDDRDVLTDALLPVVDRIANERAAAALELAGVLTVPSQDTSEEVREALFRRAAALRASNGDEP